MLLKKCGTTCFLNFICSQNIFLVFCMANLFWFIWSKQIVCRTYLFCGVNFWGELFKKLSYLEFDQQEICSWSELETVHLLVFPRFKCHMTQSSFFFIYLKKERWLCIDIEVKTSELDLLTKILRSIKVITLIRIN